MTEIQPSAAAGKVKRGQLWQERLQLDAPILPSSCCRIVIGHWPLVSITDHIQLIGIDPSA